MMEISLLEPVDYLLIGHLTVDQTPDGPRTGGTVTYAGLMAQALGLRVGVVTSWGAEIPLGIMSSIPIASHPVDRSTTFENIYISGSRVQYVRHVADELHYYHVPEPWRKASIVHLAPVAQEVDPLLVRNFPSALIGVTPQGWLRRWDEHGLVSPTEWPEADFVLHHAGAAVLSIDDLNCDDGRIDELAAACHVLAVTEGAQGARLYWNGDVRRFRPPVVEEVDATGAGDIFAAAFFTRLFTTRDPWEAARFATQLSAISVTRFGLNGVPTAEEVGANLVEVF